MKERGRERERERERERDEEHIDIYTKWYPTSLLSVTSIDSIVSSTVGNDDTV